jgi:uncharacterized protein YbjQ (UPF0145 family)
VIAPDAVVTFERLEGFAVARSLGTVRGEAFLPRSILRSTFRTIGTLIGVASPEYVTDAERARGEAIERMLGSAQALGANGVVGLGFDATEGDDGSTHVIAFGEAVLLEPAPR